MNDKNDAEDNFERIGQMVKLALIIGIVIVSYQLIFFIKKIEH